MHFIDLEMQQSLIRNKIDMRIQDVLNHGRYILGHEVNELENIPSMIYYRIPLHLQKVFKSLEYSKGDIPISEEISEKIFSLPLHPYFKRK